MIVSMTGFASSSIRIPLSTGEIVTLTINLKSLNSRFFEVTCKLPSTISMFETEFIHIFKTKLRRGHIFCTITMSSSQLIKTDVEPSLSVIEGYLNAIKAIKKQFKITGDITISELVQLPNVFVAQEKMVDAKTKKIILDAIKDLADDLVTVRTREGKVLEKDIKSRINTMKKKISDISTLSETVMITHKEKVARLLAELAETAEEDVAQRRALLYAELDKADITEELVRFSNHLANVQTALEAPTMEQGKFIDFTLQELIREINTIASKCSDATMSSLVVEIKVEIEKIREQAQNIV